MAPGPERRASPPHVPCRSTARSSDPTARAGRRGDASRCSAGCRRARRRPGRIRRRRRRRRARPSGAASPAARARRAGTRLSCQPPAPRRATHRGPRSGWCRLKSRVPHLSGDAQAAAGARLVVDDRQLVDDVDRVVRARQRAQVAAVARSRSRTGAPAAAGSACRERQAADLGRAARTRARRATSSSSRGDLPEDRRAAQDRRRADLDGRRAGHQHLDRIDAAADRRRTPMTGTSHRPRDVADAAHARAA